MGNKNSDKIKKVSRTLTQNCLESVTNETGKVEQDKEVPKERYISPEIRKRIIDDLIDKIIDDGLIMEYQKIIIILDNTPSQPSKFRTKNWVEVNDDSSGMHYTTSQIKSKTSILKSSLCDYRDVYVREL